MNAVFGIKIQICVSENLVLGLMVCSIFYHINVVLAVTQWGYALVAW